MGRLRLDEPVWVGHESLPWSLNTLCWVCQAWLLQVQQIEWIETPGDELDDIAQSQDFEFDLDIYKIVRKAIATTHTSRLVKLGVL